MKILKYFFFIVLFCGVSALSAQVADPVHELQKLSPEELSHIEKQKQIDETAVQNAQEIRKHLDSVMAHVESFSPSIADFLNNKFLD